MTSIQHSNPIHLTGHDGPMALVGSAPGWSVVAQSTLLQRPNYFDGRFLRADDLRAEQQYVRSLVALSNQAIGSGVAYGFSIGRDPGDILRVGPGLALAPSGRVIHLPDASPVPIGELIERSVGSGSAGATFGTGGGSGSFGPCPPAEPAAPDATSSSQSVYLVTIAPAEALCGNEDVYGHLCEDACLSDTERSTVVEGIRVRVRAINVGPLATSTAVTFTSSHLRSRIASAFFAADHLALPHLISGSGLDSQAWCDGAGAVGADRGAYGMTADEVPLGVLVRSGSSTVFVDQWTGRRELTEPPARRWWAWRMAMRPWDAFLAQILQFQCQLSGLAAGGTPTLLPGDPCEAERDVLQQAHALLASMQGDHGDVLAPVGGVDATGTINADRERFDIGGTWPALAALAGKIEEVLSASGAPSSASVLIDRGFVELPPAGYLPVDPAGDVEAQVRAFIGNGVDLRFCAVRADYVPHALETAQHMERISLTDGLDDPSERPEVDILVPDGRIERTGSGPAAPAYVGRARLMPSVRRDDPEVMGAVLGVDVVGRERNDGDGWGWAMAGYGEAPHNLSIPGLFSALGGRPPRPAPAPEPAPVPEPERERGPSGASFPVAEERNWAVATGPSVIRANAERYDATRRRATSTVTGMMAAVAPIPPGEPRSMAAWVDLMLARDPFTATQGQSVDARLRLSAYSPAASTPVLADLQFQGKLVVLDRTGAPGSSTVTVRTRLEAFGQYLRVEGGQAFEESGPVPPEMFTWRLERRLDGSEVVTVTQTGHPQEIRRGPVMRFVAGRSGADVAAGIGLIQDNADIDDGDDWDDGTEPIEDTAGARAARLRVNETWGTATVAFAPGIPGVGLDAPIATMEAVSMSGALAPGQTWRDLGESAIEIIAGDLEHRRPGFRNEAMAALLGASQGSAVTTLHAERDWVMFHRRRSADCTGSITSPGEPPAPTPVPVPTRRYRHFNAVVTNDEQLRQLLAELGKYSGLDQETFAALAARMAEMGLAGGSGHGSSTVTGGAGFSPVTVVEFRGGTAEITSDIGALKSAWNAAQTGSALILQLVGDVGSGDGETVAVERAGAVRDALSGLVDVRPNAEVHHLNELPPEYRGTSIDGAILIVTHEVVIGSAPERTTAIRIGPNAYGRLSHLVEAGDLASAIDIAEALRAETADGVDQTVLRYDPTGGGLLQPDEYADWWGDSSPPGDAVLLVPTGHDLDVERRRAEEALDMLGTNPETLTWSSALLLDQQPLLFLLDTAR